MTDLLLERKEFLVSLYSLRVLVFFRVKHFNVVDYLIFVLPERKRVVNLDKEF